MEITKVPAQEAAKQLRKDLKCAFGKYYSTKFSVTTQQESFRTYIHVRWSGGPLFHEVDRIAQNVCGYECGDRAQPIVNHDGPNHFRYEVDGVICQRV